MSKTPLFVAFSDLQIKNWKNYNAKKHARLIDNLDVLRVVSNRAKKLGVPVLFLGDLFDEKKALANEVFDMFVKYYQRTFETNCVDLYAISGNHDMSEQNFHNNESPSYVRTFSRIFETLKCLDFSTMYLEHFAIHGIPYVDGNVDFEKHVKAAEKLLSKTKPNILMIHTDLWGAEDTDNRVVNTVENIPKKMASLFKKFDLVLAGHIHKPQQLGKHIFMLGAPQHQRTSDRGCNMGYWVGYKDLSMEFIPLDQYPQFIEIEEGTEPPDKYNFYIQIPKQKEKSLNPNKLQFSNKTNKIKLGKNYCKASGVTDKGKIKALVTVIKKSGND